MAAAKKAATKPVFQRCPHCSQRYGSETSLAAHIVDHRAKYMDEMIKPEHKAVLHPLAMHQELKAILKRGGHGT